MYKITSITNQPRQKFIIAIENNQQVIINLYYYETQKAWYFDFQYGDYISKGNKAVLTYNAIRHLRKRLPFGIGFLSESKADPCDLDAFLNKQATMIVLNKTDIQKIEEKIYGK